MKVSVFSNTKMEIFFFLFDIKMPPPHSQNQQASLLCFSSMIFTCMILMRPGFYVSVSADQTCLLISVSPLILNPLLHAIP